VKAFKEDAGTFNADLWIRFASHLHYVARDIETPSLFQDLARKCAEIKQCNLLFYLSTQPSYYAKIVAGLQQAHLAGDSQCGWRRIIVEKPFGRDLDSAKSLNSQIHAVFPEQDTYRIDHYLGKETVQNVLAFRFGNGIYEPLWNRRYINHIQITAAEEIGV